MSKFKKLVLYWLPPLIWMSLIFYFSSRQRVSVSETYVLNFIFFKTLHVIEYAILYLLLFRATLPYKSFSKQSKALFPLVIAALYAVSDEIHQTYVPTREGTLRDVFIDMLGISIMYIYIKTKRYEKI